MAISACIDFTSDRWYNSTIYVRHVSDKRKVHLMKTLKLVLIALVAIVVTGCVSRAPKKAGLPTPSNEKEVPRYGFLWIALLLAMLASGCAGWSHSSYSYASGPGYTWEEEHGHLGAGTDVDIRYERFEYHARPSQVSYGPGPVYYYNGPIGTRWSGGQAPRYSVRTYRPQPNYCPPPQPRQWCPPPNPQPRGNGGYHNAAGGNIVGHR